MQLAPIPFDDGERLAVLAPDLVLDPAARFLEAGGRGLGPLGGDGERVDEPLKLAPLQAEAQALARLDEARAALLVEGISDQIALETLAARQGRDLAEEKILVVPIGGAQSILRYLRLLGPEGSNIPVAGLCHANEDLIFRRGLARAGLGSPQNREELAGLGFFVCDADLESELIRALGPAQKALETGNG